VPVRLTVPVAAPSRLSPDERIAVEDAAARVIGDGPWVGGPEVERFEIEFAAYLGARDVLGVASGTDALALAFTALELPPGSGILIAANEGGYAATAARQVGLVPLVMDIDELTLVPTVGTAEVADSPNASALVVTHLHGSPVDLTELDAWRTRRGLRLIEDCAQATGLRIRGRHVGLTGDAAAFSFYPTKNLGAMGDGGAVVLTDARDARRARSLAQYGWDERFRIGIPGGRNSRLDALQAAILRARLPFLDARNDVRRGISSRYREALVPRGSIFGDAIATVAHHSVAVVEELASLATALTDSGVEFGTHYPFLLNEMPGLALGDAPVPVTARHLRDHSLSLPCFPELTTSEVDLVAQTLSEWAHG
jgi:aminotransferase EvaB